MQTGNIFNKMLEKWEKKLNETRKDSHSHDRPNTGRRVCLIIFAGNFNANYYYSFYLASS